ncbi:MAG: hypothetical protein P8Y71_01910 [Pseudolabrys sp.]
MAGYAEKSRRQARRFVRMASRYSLEREARELLDDIGEPHDGQLRVAGKRGWAGFDVTELAGMKEPFAHARRLGEAWCQEKERWADQRYMPFNLIRTGELLAHREFMDIALQEDILRAVSGYLGQVPRLYRLYVWWSPPNNTLESAQLFHYDHRDSRQAKDFINLRDVTADMGPLHFLGADQSLRFDAKVGYSNRKITDEKIFSVFRPSDLLNTAGSAGKGFIIDTGRCLHYGSRGNLEGRLMLMASFTRVNCLDSGSACPILDPIREEIATMRYADDPVRTFALTAPQ